MTDLTPRVYGQNMQLRLIGQNTITSAIVPELNNTLSESSTIATEHVTAANVNGTLVNLPIATSTAATYFRTMSNTRTIGLFVKDYNFAKSRVECVMATGTTVFTFDEPLESVPKAEIKLLGKSYEIGRGGGVFNNYPSADDLADKSFDLSNWIKSNSSTTTDYLHADYMSVINLNPWINKIVPTPDLPAANDVRTAWYKPGDGSEWFALGVDWKDESNMSTEDEVTMLPAVPSLDEDALMASIKLNNIQCYAWLTVTPVSKFKVEVSWYVPVRYTYAAASRGRNFWGSYNDIDNFAFLDEVTQIDIDLIAQIRGDNINNVVVSLNSDGSFKRGEPTENSIKLDNSDVVTVFASYIWPDGVASSLAGSIGQMLTYKYHRGKYVAECDVPMQWVYDEDIDIDSEIRLQLQNGEYVTRSLDNEPIVFKVQNMTLKFNATRFIYTLQLMEV